MTTSTSRWTKPLPLNEEKFLGRTFAPDIPDDYKTEADILLPSAWVNSVGFLADGDRLRLRNSHFDFMAIVTGVGIGGIVLEKEGSCITPEIYARLERAEAAAVGEDESRQLATIGPRPQVSAR